MKGFRFYKTLNILSVDVVVGSVISYYFFCAYLHVSPSIITASVLALTVWSIYTLDHLMDAKKSALTIETARHLYHRVYFRPLSIVLIVAISTIAILLFRLDPATLRLGVVLSCLVVVYFISVHLISASKVLHKELTVAVLYTAGILIGPISQISRMLQWVDVLCFLAFFHVVLINLLLFSSMEKKVDDRAGFPSLPLRLGENFTPFFRYILWQGSVLCMVTMVVGLYLEGLLMLGMIALLTILHTRRSPAMLRNHFRLVGDGVFFLLTFYFL